MEFEDEEEEDLLNEKSDLNIYLNKVCSDYQCHNSLFQQTHGTLSTDVKKVTDEREIIESDIADQVHIVLLSKLILDEDRNVVEEIYYRFKIVKTNLLKNITSGSFSMLFMVLGMYFYYALGAFILLFISVYYAFRATDCLWQNHYRKKQLEKLIQAIRCHYKTARKVMKFIIENDCMLKACSLDWARMHQIEVSHCKKYSQHMFNARLKSFNNLKSAFINTEIKCIKIFVKYTNNLVKLYPLLYDFLNDVQLCNDSILTDINCETDYIKLHDAYLLTQSEFLQRLIYCLIPNIHVSPNKNCKEIQLIINKITSDFEMLTKQLNSKFKYVFIHGVHTNYSIPTVNVEETDIQDKNQQQLLMNLHYVSKTLQNLLITSRTVESQVANGIINVPQVEEKLLSLKNDLKTCQSELDDSFIFLKRLNSCDPQNLKLPTYEENSKFENCIDNKNKIQVGFTDLDPNVNDEIFEAYILDVDEKDSLYGNDFMMDEERDRKRLEKEYSKHVLKELKTKLIIKAKEWEMREAKVLKEKGLSLKRDDKESGRKNMMDKDQENILPSENWPLPSYKRCKKPNQNKKRKNKDLKYNEGLLVYENMSESAPIDNRLAEKVEEICINNNTNIQESCISRENAFSNSVNMNLLSKSILEARKEILNKDFIEEETFCASGENSEEELLE